jgi:hypothetical protein
MAIDGVRPIRCALLTSFRFDWAASIALSCPGLAFVTLAPDVLGLRDAPNPFALPPVDQVDVVLLSTTWYEWLVSRHGDKVDDVMRLLEARSTILVGLDPRDDFGISLPPRVIERAALVLMPQGLYRDRDLYNYDVGPIYPGAIWTEKRRPREGRYREQDLDKLKLSVPCFMMDFAAVRHDARVRETGASRTVGRDISRPERLVRDAAEQLLMRVVTLMPIAGRRLEVHCVVGLTHVQRIEALGELAGFSGKHGITIIRDSVGGTDYGLDPLPLEAWRELEAAAAPFKRQGIGRSRFMLDVSRHKIGVAPTGTGELGQRHAAILFAGAALVCQDLSHVEMMFPMRDRDNVVFCKPDLSNLRSTVAELLRDDDERQRIARQGRADLVAWATGWRDHLYVGIEGPIRDALGLCRASVTENIVAGR